MVRVVKAKPCAEASTEYFPGGKPVTEKWPCWSVVVVLTCCPEESFITMVAFWTVEPFGSSTVPASDGSAIDFAAGWARTAGASKRIRVLKKMTRRTSVVTRSGAGRCGLVFIEFLLVVMSRGGDQARHTSGSGTGQLSRRPEDFAATYRLSALVALRLND